MPLARPAAIKRVRLQRLRRMLEPVIRRVMHFYWRFSRGATLGTRAMVINGAGRVFLVKHSYIDGWHLPGGGVETGETLHEALKRELMEEGRIELAGEATLFGIYLNSHVSRRDHVALYVVRHFAQDRKPEPNREIIDCDFFDLRALPPDTTVGTRLRIAEVTENKPQIPTWR